MLKVEDVLDRTEWNIEIQNGTVPATPGEEKSLGSRKRTSRYLAFC